MKNIIKTTAAIAILFSVLSPCSKAQAQETESTSNGISLSLAGGLGIDGEPNFDNFNLSENPQSITVNPSDLLIQTVSGNFSGIDAQNISIPEITLIQDSSDPNNYIFGSPFGEGNPFLIIDNVPLADFATDPADVSSIGNDIGRIEFFFEDQQSISLDRISGDATDPGLITISFDLVGTAPQATFTLFSVEDQIGTITDEIDEGDATIDFDFVISQSINSAGQLEFDEVLNITIAAIDTVEFTPTPEEGDIPTVPEPSIAIGLIALGFFGLGNRSKGNSKFSKNN